ncbi:hypothetical protein M1L60_03845 [Actinoplanes sp. TRM 88003]|uniref:Uncharacterized protein n=1 Tax=Paractinoplanes aksuensis TaxID=2939490 RepID=A0ABT1DFX8_9ACTN|nr:hypothetical protein [Actinoplanes aksuensis]MCO8269722.1 hypothetical protein [Actinoplanes aksuensis]
MVDMDVAESARSSRVDTVMAAAIVLTVDAVVLLAVAVIGVPFLVFMFGDADGTWHRLWPLIVAWLVAVALAALCATAVARLSGFGSYSIRRIGTAAALSVAVAAAVLAAAGTGSNPGWLLLGLPFAVANLAAALVLANPERAIAVSDRFPRFVPAPAPAPVYEAESAYARPEDETPDPVRTHDTIDLLAFEDRRRVKPRRRRGPAATRTLAGVQLPRRARRPQSRNDRRATRSSRSR